MLVLVATAKGGPRGAIVSKLLDIERPLDDLGTRKRHPEAVGGGFREATMTMPTRKGTEEDGS